MTQIVASIRNLIYMVVNNQQIYFSELIPIYNKGQILKNKTKYE